ncbi:MAG: hypothetical protein U9N51_01995 [Bacteroidota bacterium]|nr:hypothetical protein [Bacteroidota bacterium]
MNKIALLGIITLLISMISCDDSIDVLADYEEIPVVYCLLNQNDDFHYVKVNKAFLGEAPAESMAQVSDSLFYDDVEVWIEVTANGEFVRRMNFTPVDTIPKPDGYFTNERNTVYIHEGAISPSTTSGVAYQYELHVDIISKNMYCKSVEPIGLVDNVQIIEPTVNRQIAMTHYENGKVNAEYRTGENASLYQMIFRFYYIEVDLETNDTVWDLDPIQITLTEDIYTIPNQDIKKEFTVQQFYQLVGDNIPVKDGVQRLVRYPESVEFILYSADQNYKVYSEVSAPSSGIVQEKPFWTNIESESGYAAGLFAARYQTSIVNRVTAATLDSLSRGVYTKDLNFATKNNWYYVSQ